MTNLHKIIKSTPVFTFASLPFAGIVQTPVVSQEWIAKSNGYTK